MAEFTRGAVRKFVGKELRQVIPSERTKYLQNEVNKLDKIIGIQKAIGLRYRAIKFELEKLLVVVRDESKFSKEKQVSYPEGRHANERVWDIERDPNLRQDIANFKQRLSVMLGEIRWIESMDIKIEEGESRDIPDDELKDLMKKIEVGLDKLRGMLGKFDRIWKKIKELERGKKITVDIAEECEEFEREIGVDVTKIYENKNKDRIDRIRNELNVLKNMNDKLKKLVGKEFILEDDEREILEMLVRGLRRWEDWSKIATESYEGFEFHPHLLSGYLHFETDLNEKEEDTIVYSITPFMARLYQLTYKLKEVIGVEEEKIKEFKADVTKVKRVREKRHLSSGDIDKARSLWGKFKEIYSIIKDKELPLARYISDLEDRIKSADEILEGLENEREGIIREVEEVI